MCSGTEPQLALSGPRIGTFAASTSDDASVTTMDFYLYMGLEPSKHLRNDEDVIRVNWEVDLVCALDPGPAWK